MSEEFATTWDGLPISPEAPFGTSIVVYRRVIYQGTPGVEFLILHRAQEGPDYEGDWAWTPPSGARLPNEDVDVCARRELWEETQLTIPIQRTEIGHDSWALYLAEATNDDVITLDAEHDRYEWVLFETACARCLPVVVTQTLQHAATLIADFRLDGRK